MNEKVQISFVGEIKTHLGINYCNFEDELSCPICNKRLFAKDTFENNQPVRDTCPHVLYFWEETHLGGHFFCVRPDFAKNFIEALLGSEYYREHLLKPKVRPLKKNEIAQFASGGISPVDYMFNHGYLEINDPRYLEIRRYEHTGSRVGNISHFYPSIKHPEILPQETVVFLTDYSVGYTGLRIRNRKNSHGDLRTLNVAICPTEFHNPGVRGLS